MFIKKILTISFFSLLVFGGATRAQAQEIAPEKGIYDVTLADLNAEGPLTARDIDVYLKYLYLTRGHEARKNPEATSDPEGRKILEFAKDNGLSIVRLRYILEKVPFGSMVAVKPDPESAPTPPVPYLKLSTEEIKVLTDNLNRILEAYEALK
ncbi:MAG: hypothetical protein LBS60_11065 [Deltaproteobacteria bacterium]|jgi:hypothetical protein|nr:hypothetical protein [Deltaproteobacteria bacterium]